MSRWIWPTWNGSWHRLPRLFRDEVGMGYTVWRNQLWLHLATLMLAEGRTVSQTASACGYYSSASAFVTTFRAAFGQTPGSLYRWGRRQARRRRWTCGMAATG
jgi:AraC-like DNA-binding protein